VAALAGVLFTVNECILAVGVAKAKFSFDFLDFKKCNCLIELRSGRRLRIIGLSEDLPDNRTQSSHGVRCVWLLPSYSAANSSRSS
jgi:hypothetical protein